jgi:hypothetical protein
MRRASLLLTSMFSVAALVVPASAQILPEQPATPAEPFEKYISIKPGRIALVHANLIDGTGSAARPDQTIIIENGRIVAITDSRSADVSGARIIDLTGKTVFPGIVGMHNHLFHIAVPNMSPTSQGEEPLLVPQMSFSSPRLYLAGGVTTIRTAGSVEPDADLNIKRAIDSGKLIGPNMAVTAPYIEGDNSLFVQMSRTITPQQAIESVNYWASRGATSIKIYNTVTKEVLEATIAAAHARNLKVTGHLCSITYPEAIAAGIDNLEHGFFVNTQLDPGKQLDICPPGPAGIPTVLQMAPDGPAATALIKSLVDKKVALTSTLPVFEPRVPGRPPLPAGALAAMSPQARESFAAIEAIYAGAPPAALERLTQAFKREMDLERRFVAAGGLLMAGPDPTGDGGIVPGFGDQRGIELLVEAGFSTEEAIRIATLNGAIFLELDARIGSIAVGKHADLVVVAGDPAKQISDIRNVEIVFKDGIGYDSKALLGSVKDRFGQY